MQSESMPELRPAGPADEAVLLPLVAAYHAFEQLEMSDVARARAVAPLLEAHSPLGCIWLVSLDGVCVGYAALCFGYSIEFGGRDAFLDEFYLVGEVRGRGIGSFVLERLKSETRQRGIVALHLEVAQENRRARQLYGRWGFRARDRFTLMSCRL